jgi:hypothetical protein
MSFASPETAPPAGTWFGTGAARGRGERRQAEARNTADLRGWARHADDVGTAPTEHFGTCPYKIR